MDACHILLGRPWQFDRDVSHKGRSNEYELKDKGKRIVLKPMSAQAVRAMSTKAKKKPNHTMLVSEREVEQVLGRGEMVFLLIAKENSATGQIFEDGPIADLLSEYQDVFFFILFYFIFFFIFFYKKVKYIK